MCGGCACQVTVKSQRAATKGGLFSGQGSRVGSALPMASQIRATRAEINGVVGA